MEQVCHRCHATVHEADPFCAHCGAPQLRYEPPDEPAFSASSPVTQRLNSRNAGVVSWKDAITAAAIVAVPTGLLASVLGFEVVWVIAGAMVVITFYRRRTGTLLNSRTGWHIGSIFGLFAAAVATATDALKLLVKRYGLHQGALIDQQFHDVIELNSKMYNSLFASSSPDVIAALAQAQHFWLTPDGAAAMTLGNAVCLAVIMLLFAAAGGAIGARFAAKTAHSGAR